MNALSPPHQSIQLPHLGLLQISGARAAEFLQGQVSCDVRDITATNSRLGLNCDVKGRVQASFRLFYDQDNTFYALLPRTMVPILRNSLQKYAIFSAVVLTDVSQQWQMTGIIAQHIARAATSSNLIAANEVQKQGDHFILGIAGSTPRCIVLSPCETTSPFEQTDNTVDTLEAWLLADIHTGIAVIYPETAGRYTPQQLNYTAVGAVSFQKGCYIGQEIIARTHYLGKAKYGLYHAVFTADTSLAVPGTEIYNEQKNVQGALIQCARNAEGVYEALVCLQNSAVSHTLFLDFDSGSRLTLLL